MLHHLTHASDDALCQALDGVCYGPLLDASGVAVLKTTLWSRRMLDVGIGRVLLMFVCGDGANRYLRQSDIG